MNQSICKVKNLTVQAKGLIMQPFSHLTNIFVIYFVLDTRTQWWDEEDRHFSNYTQITLSLTNYKVQTTKHYDLHLLYSL